MPSDMKSLRCAYQNYAWGKVGEDSKVYQLLLSSGQYQFSDADRQRPFAEMWMGCHPSGPSVLLEQPQVSLQQYIVDNPSTLGSPASGQPTLPFLFKVLSVGKPLSVQAHPDKRLAQQLNAARPDLYKDANHKPEMAIALTPFLALCGFRPLGNILASCEQFVEQLEPLLGQDGLQALRGAANAYGGSERALEAIRVAYGNVMRQSSASVGRALSELLAIDQSDRPPLQSQLLQLLSRVHADFPGDVGCLSVFFLNAVRLQPGEAVFLEANLPHAYLHGDCVECMACSDNVVRAGLTPKFKDVDTLLSMLNYEGRPADRQKFEPLAVGQGALLYSPPVPEFAVLRLLASAGDGEASAPRRDSAGVLLCVAGDGLLVGAGLRLRQGAAFFVPAGVDVVVSADSGADCVCYLAYQPRGSAAPASAAAN